MAYVDPNYQTKKAFKEAVAAGVEHRPYNPSAIFPTAQDGIEYIEGPHYPQPHKWYAEVQVRGGIVRSVK
jgi:hypothetical protein